MPPVRVPCRVLQYPGGTFVAYDEYVALMQRCWSEDPEDRPNFEQVGCPLGSLPVAVRRPDSQGRLPEQCCLSALRFLLEQGCPGCGPAFWLAGQRRIPRVT